MYSITVISLSILLALGITVGSGCSPESKQASEAQPIRITAIPDENPTELLRNYQPMVDYLQTELGAKIEYIPVVDYGAAV